MLDKAKLLDFIESNDEYDRRNFILKTLMTMIDAGIFDISKKEPTDTDRLDFLCAYSNQDYRALTIMWEYDKSVVILDGDNGVERFCGKTLRQAIDSAMRGKDGE